MKYCYAFKSTSNLLAISHTVLILYVTCYLQVQLHLFFFKHATSEEFFFFSLAQSSILLPEVLSPLCFGFDCSSSYEV